MNSPQRNYLIMSKQTKQYLIGQHDITDKLSDYAKPFADYCDTIIQIDAVAVLQEKNTKVVKMSKEEIRASLVDSMMVIFRRCNRFAKVNEQTQFLEIIHVSESGLTGMSDEALIVRCQNFIKDVTEKLADLAGVNVTAADVHALSEHLASFDAIFRDPNLAKAGKKGYTAQLKTLFATLKVLQGKLDAIAEGISDDNQEFWANYQYVRVVPKLGIHKTAFMLLILDALTNKGKPMSRYASV